MRENKELIKNIKRLEIMNKDFLHLTAFENQMSNTARKFLSTKLSDRYYFGGGINRIIDWSPFTCLGLPEIENLVEKAKKTAASMLSADAVEIRCLSGVHTMMCVILSLTKPGDVVMVTKYSDGGHFSTKGIIESSGRSCVYAEFDPENNNIDVLRTSQIFKKNKCKAFYIDSSYSTHPINIKDLRKKIGENGLIIYDASHTLGLMMGGKFQSPLEEGADVICGNTHKTLPGPQKGLIATKNKELTKKIIIKITDGMVSSSHTHHMIALSIAILEMKSYGKEYAEQVIKNSNSLGEALTDLGMEVRISKDGSYSKCHQVHLFIDKLGSAPVLYDMLVKNFISTNFDNRIGGRLFVRIGTQEITRIGMKGKEMETIASLLYRTLQGENTKKEVINFKSQYTKVCYSFD